MTTNAPSVPAYGTFPSSPRTRSSSSASSSSTAEQPLRFRFHPESETTPWWRKATFRLFDGVRDSTAFQDSDLWPLADGLQSEQTAAEMRWRLAASSDGVRGVVLAMVAELARQPRMIALTMGRLVCVVAEPLLVFRLFQLAAETPRRSAEICVVLLALHASYFGTSLLLCHCDYLLTKTNMRLQSGLRALLLEDVLRRGLNRTDSMLTTSVTAGSSQHRKQRIAELTNIYSGDVDCIITNVSALVLQWDTLVRLVMEIYVLSMAIQGQWRMLVVLVVCVSITVLAGSAVEAAIIRRAAALRTVYVNVIHECLKGIQMIKLYAWEDKIRAKIFRSRASAARSHQQLTLLHMLRRSLAQELPSLLLIVTFIWMINSHVKAKPSVVFTAFYFFRKLRLRMEDLYTSSKAFRAYHGATTRIDSLLPLEPHHVSVLTTSRPDAVVEFVDATLTPIFDASKPVLMNVSLRVHQGELVMLKGCSGVGKSLLLTAMRGDVGIFHGQIRTNPALRVAYCSQEPWLQTMSIRENVLFGSAFDEHKYWCVMDACGLLEDLEQLPMGDATQVGPKGINLSGGQKARIALARACYADADLYLLDCPLASVDAVVQSDVFRKCVVELLVHKTIVMVTHNPEIMGSSFVDQVVEVQDLQVHVASSPLVKRKESVSSGILSKRALAQIPVRPWESESVRFMSHNASSTRLRLPSHRIADVRKKSVTSVYTTTSAPSSLRLRRDLSINVLGPIIYNSQAASQLALVLLMAIGWGVLSIAGPIFLAMMTDGTGITHDTLLIFAVITVATLALSVALGAAHARVYKQLSSWVFERLVESIIRAPVSTFYKTPVGALLHRCVEDADTCDSSLPRWCHLLVTIVVLQVSRVIIVIYFVGFGGVFAVVVVFFALRYVLSVEFFTRLMQLEHLAQAKNLSFISETLDGEAVIRGSGPAQIASFVDKHNKNQDEFMRKFFMNVVFNCDVVAQHAHIQCLFVAMLAVVLVCVDLSPAECCILTACMLMFHHDFVWLSTGVLNSSIAIFSFVRLYQSTNVEPERDDTTYQLSVPEWPSSGNVEFRSVSFSYESARDSSTTLPPLALRDVSFSVRSGERVGVVGRTGSGKSSLAMALFRMHPLVSGRILVDGVDISRLSLKTVRSSITIIPQSPLFYRCSVRDYLDPFGEYDDGRLWREVKRVGLGGHVRSLSDELWDNGENWSLGERQMLCFARALLRPSRVLVLDEAFSSVDQGREESLLGLLEDSVQPQQQYQQSAYGNRDDGGGRCERGVASSTVFLITHRVDQILGFDRILVMANGSVVEQGSATSLASDPSSLFYDFLETSLLTM
ncbi:hypothetical protein PINS_up006247 [Pythium insidiosum]|nr:hypothetical protein PINS_up006247 [Pythium insidiosum]